MSVSMRPARDANAQRLVLLASVLALAFVLVLQGPGRSDPTPAPQASAPEETPPPLNTCPHFDPITFEGIYRFKNHQFGTRSITLQGFRSGPAMDWTIDEHEVDDFPYSSKEGDFTSDVTFKAQYSSVGGVTPESFTALWTGNLGPDTLGNDEKQDTAFLEIVDPMGSPSVDILFTFIQAKGDVQSPESQEKQEAVDGIGTATMPCSPPSTSKASGQ